MSYLIRESNQDDKNLIHNFNKELEGMVLVLDYQFLLQDHYAMKILFLNVNLF